MKLHVFALVLLLTKLCLLFFTQSIDADAVTRSQLGAQLLDNPKWISSGVWPPLHIYLTSFSMWIYDDVIWSPRIMNALFSVITLYPIFYFLKREFDAYKALIGTAIFACSPIIFHISLMNLSETSFYLFTAIGINLLSLALKKDSTVHFIIGGLTFTLAAAIRMEAWPIIAILTCSLLLNKKFIPSVLFVSAAAIFPIFWMYGNYNAHGEPLISIRAINVLEITDWENFARKIWFFPFMLFISVGPIFSFTLIKGVKNWKKNILSPWILTPILIFCLILYKSITGTMIAHPRFIGLSTLLCLPLILQNSNWINKLIEKRAYVATSIALTLCLSYLYNVHNVSPLPMLKHKEMITHSELLMKELQPKQSIFIDFLTWEDTYYMSLHLFKESSNQTVIDGYCKEDEAFQIFMSTYNPSEKQIWLLNPSHRDWSDSIYNFEIIQASENVIIAISNPD